MTEAFYWRLDYADGTTVHEPDGEVSILSAPGGATAIVVCRRVFKDGRRIPVVQELMEHPRLLKAGPWVPIFYRRKQMDVRTDGQPVDMTARTTGTVFGRGCEGANEIHLRLWTLNAGFVVDCPAHLIDMAQSQLQVMESLASSPR